MKIIFMKSSDAVALIFPFPILSVFIAFGRYRYSKYIYI